MIYVFMANGTEECEALIPVDLFRRAKLEVQTVSIEEHASILSSHGVWINTDICIEDLSDFMIEQADAIILPGGLPGTYRLGEHSTLSNIIDQFVAAKKWIGAICAAPTILAKKGLFKDKMVTCAEGFKDQLEGGIYTGKLVEQPQLNIITGKGLGATIPFALRMIACMVDQNMANEIAHKISYEGGSILG